MKGSVVLVFLLLLQLGTTDVWGDAWKKIQTTAKDESKRVLEKVDKEIGRWQKRLNEEKDENGDDPPVPQPAPIAEPTPPPPPPVTVSPITQLLPTQKPQQTPVPTTEKPSTTTEVVATQSPSTLSWTIGAISIIFVGFGAFFSVLLLAIRWYRRRHPSIPRFPPPDPPRILVERVYAPYVRMNEEGRRGSHDESEYSSINLEPVMAESPT